MTDRRDEIIAGRLIAFRGRNRYAATVSRVYEKE